jgi:hypothetical protein
MSYFVLCSRPIWFLIKNTLFVLVCRLLFNGTLVQAATGVAKDFQRFSVKPLDSFGVKEPVDKNEMTQVYTCILFLCIIYKVLPTES